MAGPYAHCLVSRKALKLLNDPRYARYSGLKGDGILPYVFLGSVSPDYPYPYSIIADKDPIPDVTPEGLKLTWGDKLHKQYTGDFMRSGLASLRRYIADGHTDSLILTAWLMGYYSHIITDTVVHAVVYNIVGKYEGHETPHRYCEMVEDTLIFKREENKELVGDNFLSILEKCQALSPFDIEHPFEPSRYLLKEPVKSFWDGLLKEVFPRYYGLKKPDIDAWHRQYLKVNCFAVSTLARAVGDAGLEAISYQKTDEIPLEDKKKYYTEMKLPGMGALGDYKVYVFDHTVEQVMEGWDNFLTALTDDEAYRTLDASLQNIDLDTGTANGIDYVLWPGGKTTDWTA